MKYFILLFLCFTPLAFGQILTKDQLDSIRWSQPPNLRDTVVTFTVLPNKVQHWVVDGDTVATLVAEQIAARRRISTDKKYWVSMAELEENISQLKTSIKEELLKIAKNDGNLSNVELGQAIKEQYKRLRQYTKTVKMDSIPIE